MTHLAGGAFGVSWRQFVFWIFFFNDPATTEIYTLSLHDALPIYAEQMAHVPSSMIHSRFDPSCPLRGAWELAQVWPAARLHILPGTTHSALEGDMRAAIRAATDMLEV